MTYETIRKSIKTPDHVCHIVTGAMSRLSHDLIDNILPKEKYSKSNS